MDKYFCSFGGFVVYLCINSSKQNKMKKKFVIQCANTKKYFYGIWDFFNWTDNFLESTFFDSEKEAEEFIEHEDKYGDFSGKYLIILKVLIPS